MYKTTFSDNMGETPNVRNRKSIRLQSLKQEMEQSFLSCNNRESLLQDPDKTKSFLLQGSWLLNTSKNYLPETSTNDDYNFEEDIKKLQTDLNKFCCDCFSQDADWVSINNGIFLCIKCAGIHRSFGVQISFVRSLQLDLLEYDQVQMLKKGGNRKYLEFLELYKLNRDKQAKSIKYITRAAEFYRKLLEESTYEESKELEINESLFSKLPLKQGQQPQPDQKDQVKRIQEIQGRKKSMKTQRLMEPQGSEGGIL